MTCLSLCTGWQYFVWHEMFGVLDEYLVHPLHSRGSFLGIFKRIWKRWWCQYFVNVYGLRCILVFLKRNILTCNGHYSPYQANISACASPYRATSKAVKYKHSSCWKSLRCLHVKRHFQHTLGQHVLRSSLTPSYV